MDSLDSKPFAAPFKEGVPVIKFCGLTLPEDGEFAASLGADMAGFIFSRDSKRYISPEKASEIGTGNLSRVGVFVREGLQEIKEAEEEARLNFVQLHGLYEPEEAALLGPERVIRVVWPESFGDSSLLIDHLRLWDKFCALFLFDAGSSFGGHGRTLKTGDFSFLRPYAGKSLLAGGLGPSNIKGFWPSLKGLVLGFDFNSGVEISPGVKDHRAMGEIAKDLKAP